MYKYPHATLRNWSTIGLGNLVTHALWESVLGCWLGTRGANPLHSSGNGRSSFSRSLTGGVLVVQASEEVRLALEADVERLRGQLDEACDRVQQMGALQAQVARLQEQCQQLQTKKSEAEDVYQARCAACQSPPIGALKSECSQHDRAKGWIQFWRCHRDKMPQTRARNSCLPLHDRGHAYEPTVLAGHDHP